MYIPNYASKVSKYMSYEKIYYLVDDVCHVEFVRML